MTLNTVPATRQGSRQSQEGVAAAVAELQRFKVALVAGAAATTNIPITGIATADTILSVIEVPANAALVDRTSVASITSAGNIQLSQSSAGNQLIVFYYDKA